MRVDSDAPIPAPMRNSSSKRRRELSRGSGRGAGAADGDLGGAAGHLQLPGRTRARVPGHAGERNPHLRGQVRQHVSARRRGVPPRCRPQHTARARRAAQTRRLCAVARISAACWNETGGSCPTSRWSKAISIAIRTPCRPSSSGVSGPARRADAQGQRADRGLRHLPPGGPTVHRQADRAGAGTSPPGRHRHREYAAAQRAARIAATADRHRRRAQGHQPLNLRPAGGARYTRPVGGASVRGRPRALLVHRIKASGRRHISEYRPRTCS